MFFFSLLAEVAIDQLLKLVHDTGHTASKEEMFENESLSLKNVAKAFSSSWNTKPSDSSNTVEDSIQMCERAPLPVLVDIADQSVGGCNDSLNIDEQVYNDRLMPNVPVDNRGGALQSIKPSSNTLSIDSSQRFSGYPPHQRSSSASPPGVFDPFSKLSFKYRTSSYDSTQFSVTSPDDLNNLFERSDQISSLGLTGSNCLNRVSDFVQVNDSSTPLWPSNERMAANFLPLPDCVVPNVIKDNYLDAVAERNCDGQDLSYSTNIDKICKNNDCGPEFGNKNRSMCEFFSSSPDGNIDRHQSSLTSIDDVSNSSELIQDKLASIDTTNDTNRLVENKSGTSSTNLNVSYLLAEKEISSASDVPVTEIDKIGMVHPTIETTCTKVPYVQCLVDTSESNICDVLTASDQANHIVHDGTSKIDDAVPLKGFPASTISKSVFNISNQPINLVSQFRQPEVRAVVAGQCLQYSPIQRMPLPGFGVSHFTRQLNPVSSVFVPRARLPLDNNLSWFGPSGVQQQQQQWSGNQTRPESWRISGPPINKPISMPPPVFPINPRLPVNVRQSMAHFAESPVHYCDKVQQAVTRLKMSVMNKKRVCVILRGCPGSGKTTLAKYVI